MFFLQELEHTLYLHPSFFGDKIHEYLEKQLIEAREGVFNGRYFIVCILNSYDVSEGRVTPSTGQAEFVMHYKAVVWKPYKGEVLDGIVESVTETGFFVHIGPLSVFVAKGMMPSSIKFDANAAPPQWTDGGDQTIEKGTQVRLKVKGIRGEISQAFAIATIKETIAITLKELNGPHHKNTLDRAELVLQLLNNPKRVNRSRRVAWFGSDYMSPAGLGITALED